MLNWDVRTTLDIDDDLLPVLKDSARKNGLTLGQMVSKSIRESMPSSGTVYVRNGVSVFVRQKSGTRPTLEVVNALRDEE